jgi:hypothetical protein
LTRRLRAVGFREVHTQVPVRVVHGDFQKEYSIRLSIIRLSKKRDKPPYFLWGQITLPMTTKPPRGLSLVRCPLAPLPSGVHGFDGDVSDRSSASSAI